jgi:hypothetical protein
MPKMGEHARAGQPCRAVVRALDGRFAHTALALIGYIPGHFMKNNMIRAARVVGFEGFIRSLHKKLVFLCSEHL